MSGSLLAWIFAVLLPIGCSVQGATPLERAERAREAQEYGKAAEAYEDYLRQSPDGPAAEGATMQLADLYYLKLKQYDRARDAYRSYLERFGGAPSALDARRRLAEVFVALKEPGEAIAQYERLVADHPDLPDARGLRVVIADLYFDANDFSQAQLEYAKAVSPSEYDDLTERSLLRMASIAHMVRRKDEQAIPLYERVAVASPDPAARRQSLYSLSECYADLYRFDDAMATLGRIDDPAEAQYIACRKAELERQKRTHAEAPPEVDWSRQHSE